MHKKPTYPIKTSTGPSLPLASSHRAGHYFGLHPEDQPYQSDKIIVRRPSPEEAERWPQHEPDLIVFPDTDEPPILNVYRETQRPQTPLKPGPATAPVQPPSYMRTRKKPLLSSRTISLLLAISCIFFLLASSIIAFTLIRGRASGATTTVYATPDIVQIHAVFTLSGQGFGSRDLMTFTYDGDQTMTDQNHRPLELHTNDYGAFTLHIPVPDSWDVGVHTIYTVDDAQGPTVSTKITVRPSPRAPA